MLLHIINFSHSDQMRTCKRKMNEAHPKNDTLPFRKSANSIPVILRAKL